MDKRKFLMMMSGGGAVSVPSGFAWTPPFTITQSGRAFTTNLNLQTYAGITVAKTYYVDRAMPDDTGDGLTALTAVQKLTTAMAKADVDRVYIKAGVYELGYGWGATSPTRDIEIIGYGGVVRLSAHRAGLGWALDTTHYEVSQATKIWNVWDASILDGNGDYSMLTRVTSEAEVEATAGTWYWDDASDMLFVRTSDDRAPDADILPMETSTYCGLMTAAKTLYIEGLSFEGGATNFGGVSTSALTKVYSKNCTFKYCYNANGTLISGCGEAIFETCTSARHIGLDATATDGFKCIENTGQYANVALINCTGRHNGKSGGTASNGYSRHDRGCTIVIGGEYYDNYGRNIQDVDAGVGDPQTWILGASVHDCAAAAPNDVNIAIGTGVTGGTMWIDSVTSAGSAVDIEANTNATLYVRDLDPATPATAGAGTIAAY